MNSLENWHDRTIPGAGRGSRDLVHVRAKARRQAAERERRAKVKRQAEERERREAQLRSIKARKQEEEAKLEQARIRRQERIETLNTAFLERLSKVPIVPLDDKLVKSPKQPPAREPWPNSFLADPGYPLLSLCQSLDIRDEMEDYQSLYDVFAVGELFYNCCVRMTGQLEEQS